MLYDAPPHALTGRVPLLRLSRLAPELQRQLFLLHEGMEPQGTIASRVALALLPTLSAGAPLIVAADAGLALALGSLRATEGGGVTAVLCADLSHEARALMVAWGVALVRTDVALGREGALARARELATQRPGSVLVDPEALPVDACDSAAISLATGLRDALPELPGMVLVPAVLGRPFTVALLVALAASLPGADLGIVVAEAQSAPDPVTRGATAVQGLQLESVPAEERNASVFAVSSAEAWSVVRAVARREGVLVGPATGAVLAAALRVGEGAGPLVAIGVDTGERYFSLRRFHHDAEPEAL